jgi:hypothetical protein
MFSYYQRLMLMTSPTVRAQMYPHHLTSRLRLALFCLNFYVLVWVAEYGHSVSTLPENSSLSSVVSP